MATKSHISRCKIGARVRASTLTDKPSRNEEKFGVSPVAAVLLRTTLVADAPLSVELLLITN